MNSSVGESHFRHNAFCGQGGEDVLDNRETLLKTLLQKPPFYDSLQGVVSLGVAPEVRENFHFNCFFTFQVV